MDSTLVVVDSLMWSRPDSAFVLLQERFSPDDPYAQLLLAELLYKNDYAQTNHGALLDIVDGFGATPFLSARAHYINGVGYYENDSVAEACQEYLKALEIMEDHFKEKELVGHKAQFMALAYTRLTVLFSDQYLPEQAIYFAKQSLGYYEKSPSPTWHRAWMMDELGLHYEMLQNLDSAGYYYTSAMECLNETTSLMHRDIEAHLTHLSYQKEGLNDSIMNVLYGLLSKAESTRESCARCLTLGGVYFDVQSLDSAWKYLNIVYENTDRRNAKKLAAERLTNICTALGREDEALEYNSYLVSFATIEEQHGTLKSQLSELYMNHIHKRTEQQHDESIRHILRQVTLVLGGLLLLLLAILYLYHRSKNKRLMIERQLKEERFANEMKRRALLGRYKNKEKLGNQKAQVKEQKINDEASERHPIKKGTENYESLLQAPICKEILGVVELLHQDPKTSLKTTMEVSRYKKYALSTEQLISLSQTIDKFFPYLYPSLKAHHPSMSKKEWNYCLLFLLQLKSLDICVLLQEPYYTCRRCTQKMERIFQCKQSLSFYLISKI
jgi:predicted negative regulator of RcsB-dependent stress response